MNSRNDSSRTPRNRPDGRRLPAPITAATGYRAARPACADHRGVCRSALRLARALHRAGPDPAGRKRLLLEGLCRAAGAERGVLAVTRTDLRTGLQELVSVVAGHLPATLTDACQVTAAEPTGGAAGPATGPPAPHAVGRRPSAPCLDAFLPLDGLRLVACLMMVRPAGGRPFSADDRGLVDVLHAECRWVYAHDVRLAADDVWGLPPAERRIVQDVLAGLGEAAIARRNEVAPAVAARQVAAVLGRLGARSRAELLLRWDDAGPA